MALTVVGVTAAIATSASATTPTVPDGAVGDHLYWFVGWGVGYTGTSYPTATNRPTLSGSFAGSVSHMLSQVGGENDAVETWGVDTGKRAGSLFSAVATATTGSTNQVTFNTTGDGTTSILGAVCLRVSKASGKVILAAATGGADTSKADSLDFTGFTDVGATANDLIFGQAVIVPDTVNPGLVLAWPGCTLGTQSNLSTGAVTSGNDLRMNIRQCTVSSGTSSGAPSLTSGTTGAAGAGIILRLREADPTASMSAGADQSNVEPYSTVTLDSSASTGVASGRTWSQTAGTAVTLSSTTATSPTFRALGSLNGLTQTFRVTDNTTGLWDEVVITTLPSSRRVMVGGVVSPVERRVVFP
jgi:hypothetical protein